MNKIKLTKGKIAALVAVGCMAVSLPVQAFNEYYGYAIGPNASKQIAGFVPGTSKIYLNTRPSSGGDVRIVLSGAAEGSHTFPYQVYVDDWAVNVENPATNLIIRGEAGDLGSAGSLHVWSN